MLIFTTMICIPMLEVLLMCIVASVLCGVIFEPLNIALRRCEIFFIVSL